MAVTIAIISGGVICIALINIAASELVARSRGLIMQEQYVFLESHRRISLVIAAVATIPFLATVLQLLGGE